MSKKEHTEREKSMVPNISKRLLAYSAAVSGCISFAGSAEAAVKCRILGGPLVVDNSTSQIIDIDGDGTDDFSIGYVTTTVTTVNPGHGIQIQRLDGNNRFSGSTYYTNYFYPYRRAQSFAVNANKNQAAGFLALFWPGSTWGANADWNNPVKVGYIGVKFNCGSAPTCEGWILYDQLEGTPPNIIGLIEGWGWEDSGGDIMTRENCSGPTSVELASLNASVSGLDVRLEWQTSSEIDLVGFHVWRSKEADTNGYSRITEQVIQAQGGPTQSVNYELVDADLEAGRTYFYKLEAIDASGESTFHGPISAETSEMGAHTWEIAEADASSATAASADVSKGVNVLSLLLTPAAMVLFWLRRRRNGKN